MWNVVYKNVTSNKIISSTGAVLVSMLLIIVVRMVIIKIKSVRERNNSAI